MDKERFERFITKYNLNGTCESVLIKSTGTALTVSAASQDQSVASIVHASNIQFPEGEYPVYETQKLKSLLAVANADNNLKVSVVFHGNVPGKIMFSDGFVEVNYALADKIAIPSSPNISKPPPFESTVYLDQQFIASFIRAKAALSDSDSVLITCSDSGTATFHVGHSNVNTSNIVLSAKCDSTAQHTTNRYSAKYLRDVLVANKDVRDAELMVSAKGLIKIVFMADGMSSTYYITKSLSS